MATASFLHQTAPSSVPSSSRALSAPHHPSQRLGLTPSASVPPTPLTARRRTPPAAASLPGDARPGRLSVRCRAGIDSVGESDFAETVLGSDVPVLVEFVADWCGPCRLMASIINWASQVSNSNATEYDGKIRVVKVDHDANPQLIKEYKIYGLPGLILFKNGQEVPESRREGAITKVELKKYLDDLLETTSVV